MKAKNRRQVGETHIQSLLFFVCFVYLFICFQFHIVATNYKETERYGVGEMQATPLTN